jgi:hypothetical protein
VTGAQAPRTTLDNKRSTVRILAPLRQRISCALGAASSRINKNNRNGAGAFRRRRFCLEVAYYPLLALAQEDSSSGSFFRGRGLHGLIVAFFARERPQ